MKRIVIIYGLIAGTIVGSLLLASMSLWNAGVVDLTNGHVVGYTTMVIALSMVFFGIKSFRDNHQKGVITFGKGLLLGTYITLIASVMYALAWEVSYRNMPSDFIRKMEQSYVDQAKAKGATEEELKSMADFWVMYQNPFIRFGVTLTEILPVGIIITLLSASLLRKKEFLPLNT